MSSARCFADSHHAVSLSIDVDDYGVDLTAESPGAAALSLHFAAADLQAPMQAVGVAHTLPTQALLPSYSAGKKPTSVLRFPTTIATRDLGVGSTCGRVRSARHGCLALSSSLRAFFGQSEQPARNAPLGASLLATSRPLSTTG